MSSARHIKVLALCHEGKVLASHQHWGELDGELLSDFEATLRRIFSSAGWAQVRASGRRKLELREPGCLYPLELDAEGRVLVAITTVAYPTRRVFSAGPPGSPAAAEAGPRLMAELSAHVLASYARESLSSPEKGLKRSLRGFLKQLATRFDDLETMDKILATEGKAQALKATLHKSLAAADERSRLINEVEASSESIAKGAKDMFRAASKARSHARCAANKPLLCCGGCCFFIVAAAAIVLGLNSKYKWFSYSDGSIALNGERQLWVLDPAGGLQGALGEGEEVGGVAQLPGAAPLAPPAPRAQLLWQEGAAAASREGAPGRVHEGEELLGRAEKALAPRRRRKGTGTAQARENR